jgi:hypothetical protein
VFSAVASCLSGIVIAFHSARFLLRELVIAVAVIAAVVLGASGLAARTTVIDTTVNERRFQPINTTPEA